MARAGDVAVELRKFVENLENNPDVDIPKTYMHFSTQTKDQFLAVAGVIPRPFKKSVVGENGAYPQIEIKHDTDNVCIWALVLQSLTCTLVEPAKPAVYKCDPILSEDEDAKLAKMEAGE